MTCSCGKNAPKLDKECGRNTPPVIQLDSKECPVLFHTVNITAEQGDKDTLPPTYGAYKNTRVYYEANRMSYLYDSDGIPQILSGTGLPEVTSVNGQAGDVSITLESLGGASTEALAAETAARLAAEEDVKSDIESVDDKVDANTTAITAKANATDVYTKTEVDGKLADIGSEIDIPTSYWGQQPVNKVVSGDITLAGGNTITWGSGNPSIVGNGQSSMMLRSGILESDTSGQYTQVAVGRTGLVLDHYANGAWERKAKISGVADGTGANDAINLSQIQSTGWVSVENSGSSYNKAGAVVTVNISESGTFTAGNWITLFTLPEGYRPSITVTSAATVVDATDQSFVSAVVNVANDGSVQFTTTVDVTNVYGSVTFLV